MVIMFARTLNDHVVIGTLGEEATKRRSHAATKGDRGWGAELAFCLAAVIRLSKSSGSGNAGPFEEL